MDWNKILTESSNWWTTSEGVVTVVGCIVGGIVAIIGAIAGINNKRQHNCDNPKCCVTGRKLKSKKNKKADGKPKG